VCVSAAFSTAGACHFMAVMRSFLLYTFSHWVRTLLHPKTGLIFQNCTCVIGHCAALAAGTLAGARTREARYLSPDVNTALRCTTVLLWYPRRE
jgi:hypothetical protein